VYKISQCSQCGTITVWPVIGFAKSQTEAFQVMGVTTTDNGRTAIKVIGFFLEGEQRVWKPLRVISDHRRLRKDCSQQCGRAKWGSKIWRSRLYGVRLTAGSSMKRRVGGGGEAIRRAQNFRSRVSIVRGASAEPWRRRRHGSRAASKIFYRRRTLCACIAPPVRIACASTARLVF